jgi:hypothetical protein
MAKTEFLQIRVSPDDLIRIREAAEADHLDTSTWARRVILRAVDEWENQSADGATRDSRGER